MFLIKTTNYTIVFSFNVRIREIPIGNVENLSAFQIPFILKNLTSCKKYNYNIN